MLQCNFHIWLWWIKYLEKVDWSSLVWFKSMFNFEWSFLCKNMYFGIMAWVFHYLFFARKSHCSLISTLDSSSCITHVRFRIYPPSVSFLHSLHSVNSKWKEKDDQKNYIWLICLSSGTVLKNKQNIKA